MSNIQPNTQKIYLSPVNYLNTFVFEGRRYYETSSMCLVSDYGKYGILPPAGKGFYLRIAKKDFLTVQKKFIDFKSRSLSALSSGYLKTGGVQATFAF